MPSIVLSSDLISIELKTFTEDSFPREFLTSTGVSYSAWGAPATDGTSYEPKCLWNLVALANKAEAQKLTRLWVLSQKQNLRLIDTIDPIWEESATPARAIAPDTEIEFVDGGISYFAQFDCRMTQPIKQAADGKLRRVTLQLTETDRVLP